VLVGVERRRDLRVTEHFLAFRFPRASVSARRTCSAFASKPTSVHCKPKSSPCRLPAVSTRMSSASGPIAGGRPSICVLRTLFEGGPSSLDEGFNVGEPTGSKARERYQTPLKAGAKKEAAPTPSAASEASSGQCLG
jgi:hypothetical protein